MQNRMLVLSLLLFLWHTNSFAQKRLPLNDGLIARYLMNADAKDVSGNKNNGKVIGGVTPVEDRFGRECGAMHFNGSDGYITVPDSKTLDTPSDELSVTVWFKLEDGCAFSDLKWLTIVCKSDMEDELDNSPHYRLQTTSVTVSLNTAFTEEAEQDIEFGNWYFYAMTYDKKKVRIFLNGVKMWEFPYYETLDPNNLPLEIGRDVPGNMEYFCGTMDDLRIYNRALESSDLMKLLIDQTDVPRPCGQPAPVVPQPPVQPEVKPAPKPKPPKKRKTKPVVVTTPPKPTPPPPPQPAPEIPAPEPEPVVVLPTTLPPTAPTAIAGLPVDYQKTIEVKSDQLTFYIYDHEKDDSDTVSINFNGQWVVNKYRLRTKDIEMKKFVVTVQPDVENFLVSKAWNLGGIPPSTLTLEVDDGVGRRNRFIIESDLSKSAGVRIIYKTR